MILRGVVYQRARTNLGAVLIMYNKLDYRPSFVIEGVIFKTEIAVIVESCGTGFFIIAGLLIENIPVGM
jgi:hypothetical protein